MSSHASLDAAAQERKARLAKLKSLKRKQPDASEEEETVTRTDEQPSVTSSYLSGRNYDVAARGPKLGFENDPSKDHDTAEIRARELADAAKIEAAKEQEEDKPLDLFKLQPKKPNWDLKRDVEKRMERLNVRTENAIARLVRERIASQKQSAEDEVSGMVGEELVSTIHAKEQQEQEEEQRDREAEKADLEEGFT